MLEGDLTATLMSIIVNMTATAKKIKSCIWLCYPHDVKVIIINIILNKNMSLGGRQAGSIVKSIKILYCTGNVNIISNDENFKGVNPCTYTYNSHCVINDSFWSMIGNWNKRIRHTDQCMVFFKKINDPC